MVQLTSTLAVFALALASVDACYQTGLIWCSWPANDVQQHIRNACWGYMDGNIARRGALQGVEFEKNSVSGLPATVCVNTGCNRKLIMQVTNLKNEKRLLLGNDCEGGLLPEAEVCMTGGTSDKFGWRFRAAPEYGQC